MGKFMELKVWQKSKDLSVFIYKITNEGVFSRDFGLRDQIRRASVSIPSNIAEGDELGTQKHAIHFLRISKGSAAELLTQSIIAFEIGYINNVQFDFIKNECTYISSMLEKLIQARQKTLKP